MKLIWKFNIALLVLFANGFAISGYVSYRVLQANARDADGMYADTWEPDVEHAWSFPSQVSAMAALLAGL